MSEFELWNELGNVYFNSGAYDEANNAYNKAIELAPEYGWPYSNLALVYVHQGRNAEAVPLYQRSIELFSGDGDKAISWNRLGNAYRRMKDCDKALAAYQRAVELDPGNAVFREDLMVIEPAPPAVVEAPAYGGCEEGGDSALAEVQAAHGRAEGQMGGSSGLEEELERGSWVSEPISVDRDLSEWLLSAPEEPAGSSTLQPVAHGVEEPEDAYCVIEANEPVTQDFRYTPEGYFPAGKTGNPYLDLNVLPIEQAFRQTDVVLENTSLERPATVVLPQVSTRGEDVDIMKRGRDTLVPDEFIEPLQKKVQSELDHLEEEIAIYKKEIEINPKNASAWDALGSLLKSSGRYADAVLAFQQAVCLDPKKAFYHYHLGLVYSAQKRYEDAVCAFQRVIELDPEYSLAHATLSGYYRKIGNETEAQKHIAIALSTMKGESEYNRACFEAICGNSDQAIELLRVALENKQTTVDWVQCDPDLDFIRDNPRFIALVG